jgi:Tfp pilus assembly PilM family ATPase
MIFSRTKGWIGVDIGTSMVKLAQVERRGSRVALVEAMCIPRQEPWLDGDDSAADLPASVEIQAALALGTRFRGRDAAVALPMAVCELRSCSIEGDTDAERRAAVSQELDEVFPGTAGTREFDYWSVELPSEKTGSADNTIAMSVASSCASRVTQDLSEAGLVGHVLDGLPLAAARAVSLGMPNAASFIAAVDWGHRRATFCSVKHGRPLFVRGLRDCGFQSVTSALCKTLAVTADEAQKLLRDHGLPDRTRGEVSEMQGVIEEVAREPLDRFIDELTRTTSYLSQQRRSLAPAKIVLLGGGAAVKRLELPVETWRLHDATRTEADDRRLPIELFGPAVALSSLAWAAQ